MKSQEIQVQADSGKENESKEKGNTENTDSETTGTEKNSGIPGKMKVDLIWKALQWLLLLPNIPLWEKAMYPYRKWSIILTDQDELIRLQHWQQEGRILSRHFAEIYYEEATAEGVRPEVAYVQAMKETGFLQYGGDASIEQYNFAGIGTTGNGVPGNSYADVRTGILAQVQHLKAYATTEPLNEACVDERYEYVKKAAAPYVQWLGQQENPQGTGWATGKNYGYDIVEMIKKMRRAVKPDALLSFFKESLILRRDDSLQFVAFINKKLYTKRKMGRSGNEN